MINPVAPFYEFYLTITQYALPSVFMTFLAMSLGIYIILCLYSLFWHIK